MRLLLSGRACGIAASIRGGSIFFGTSLGGALSIASFGARAAYATFGKADGHKLPLCLR